MSESTYLQKTCRGLQGFAMHSRYVAGHILGKGSFGTVYHAHDTHAEQSVALKISNTPDYNLTLESEGDFIKSLNRVDSSNHVIKLIDTFTWAHFKCLVYEKCVGTLLGPILSYPNKGISLNLIKIFGVQIFEALRFLNEMKIIHCDLKPENILLYERGSPAIKITDFGAAQLLCDEFDMCTYIQNSGYRAPEIFLGMQPTQAVDIWSVGCVMMELFTGRILFDGVNSPDNFNAIIEMLGYPPSAMIASGCNSRIYFQQQDNTYCLRPVGKRCFRMPGTKKFAEILSIHFSGTWRRKGKLSVCECYGFINFISKIFVYEPSERLTANDGLKQLFLINNKHRNSNKIKSNMSSQDDIKNMRPGFIKYQCNTALHESPL